MYNLFLDDIRVPNDVIDIRNQKETHIQIPEYEQHWQTVINYDEFIYLIKNNGIPNIISFDHDLADNHYTPQEYWDDYNKSKAWQESQQPYKEKTGLDCARWLIDFYLNNHFENYFPTCYIHSQNPVGADNIEGLLNSFKKQFNLEFKILNTVEHTYHYKKTK